MNRIKDSRVDAVIMFIIMLLSMSVSIIVCVNVIQQVIKDNSEIQSRTIAQMVSAKIENEFIKPITVSQTISSDVDIRKYIEGKTKEEAERVKDDMTNRLVAIGNEFNYKMVFVVSDKTKAYYTYNGISKYLEEFDWYIVIKDNNPVKLDANKIILPIILIFIAGVLIMATSFVIISMREKKPWMLLRPLTT